MPNNPSLKDLLSQVSMANPQAPQALQLTLPATDSALSANLANVYAPTHLGLAQAYGVNAANLGAQERQQAASQKQALIQSMATDLQSKNYQGALAKYAQLDPEGIKSLLPQLEKIDPSLKGQLTFAGEGGQLAAQTEYGANPRQLKLLDIEAAKQRVGDGGKDRRFEISTIRQYQKDYNTAVKSVEEQISNLGGIDSLATLSEQNPMAAAQLGVKVAKAMGEVGALSESDVKRYVQNPALADKIAAEVVKLQKGTLLPKNAKYLRESLQTIAAVAQDRSRFLKDKFVKQVSRNMDTTPEEAAYKLGFDDYSATSKSDSIYSATQESGIERVMKANGIDRATAIKELQRAGKLN